MNEIKSWVDTRDEASLASWIAIAETTDVWAGPCKLLESAIAKHLSISMIEAILSAGAKVNEDYHEPPLITAVYKNYPQAVQLLLSRGADPDAREAERTNWAALHTAAWQGNYEVVDMLLDAGANADVENQNRQTPIDLAKERGHEDVVMLLEAWSDDENDDV